MRTLTFRLTKRLLAALCCIFTFSNAHALVYTAVLSGNFNSALTWGGVLPGSLLTTDVVVIPAGINVTITGIQSFAGTSALTVNGTLTAAGPGSALVLTSGSLAGSGSITADSAVLGLTSGFTFTGSLTADRLTSTGASIPASATITVNERLHLASGALNIVGGSLVMGTNAHIINWGGSLAASGTGTLVLDDTYNVTYMAAVTAGGELGGSGLNNLVVNASGNVLLSANTAVDGMVTLTSGGLALNGRTLTFNTGSDLSASGAGVFVGNATSGIVVNTPTGLTGALRFGAAGAMLGTLTINTAAGDDVVMGTDLVMAGMLTLSAGNLDINGRTLTFSPTGNLSALGSGGLIGSPTSNVVVNSASGLAGTLRFASGASTLGMLTINTNPGTTTSLATDLTINGMLALSNGALALNGYDLMLAAGANVAGSGIGTISGDAASDITVNATAGLTGTLRFTPTAATIGNLTVNTGAAGNVFLGTDVTIGGTLALTSGMLALNGHTLIFGTTGNLSGAGTGTIKGSATSGIAINTSGGLATPLRFTAGSSMLSDLTVNAGTGLVTLTSDLALYGLLTLGSGSLVLNGNTLTFNSTAGLSASGTGSITGSAASDIVINSTYGLAGALRFAADGSILQGLTINSPSSVSLGSDLEITGWLRLQAGKIKLGASNLSVTGTGHIMGGSATSYVATDGTGKLELDLAAGMSDTFVVGTNSNYAPIIISANSSATAGNVSVNVAEGVATDGSNGTTLSSTEKVVNATWFVSSTAAGINYNMRAMWSSGMEVNGFNRSQAYLSHYTAGNWDVQAGSAAITTGGMHSVARAGITSLSPFMVSDAARGATTGTPLAAAQPAIALYPNPAVNTIRFTGLQGVERIGVYDMGGHCVIACAATGDAIDVSSLAAGNYIVRLTGSNMDVSKEFAKQ